MALILQTGRLFLREFEPDDDAFILALLNSPGWLQHIGDRGVRTQEDARQYLINGPIRSYAANGFGLWLAALKETGMPIGMCGLVKRDGLADTDIGYALLPGYAGQGYATELAMATLEYARSILGIQRIVAITTPDNAASVSLLQKIGLTFEGMTVLPGSDKELMLFGTKV